MQQLDRLELLEPVLDNLGRRHGRLKASVGFKSCYWVVFRECALFQVRRTLEQQLKPAWELQRVDEALILWRFLLQAVIERIEVGAPAPPPPAQAGYETDLRNRAVTREERGEEFCPRKLRSSGSADSAGPARQASKEASKEGSKESVRDSGRDKDNNSLGSRLAGLNPFRRDNSSAAD